MVCARFLALGLLLFVFLGAVEAHLSRHVHSVHAVKGDDSGECSDIDKRQFDTLYCTAFTCTGCCSDWCKEKCDSWKEKMEEANCACDTDPEAHTSDSYCDDEAETFHEDYKDDPWEARMSRSCTLGCKECCKSDAFLMQIVKKHEKKSRQSSARLSACKKCTVKKEKELKREKKEKDAPKKKF